MFTDTVEHYRAMVYGNATWAYRKHHLDFDDAVQEAWVAVLSVLNGEEDLPDDHDNHDAWVQTHIRHALYRRLGDEWRNKGFHKPGEPHARMAYNPLSWQPRNPAYEADCRIQCETLLTQILPLMPDIFRDILTYAILETDVEKGWQKNYAEELGADYKKIRDSIWRYRKRTIELWDEINRQRAHGSKQPALTFKREDGNGLIKQKKLKAKGDRRRPVHRESSAQRRWRRARNARRQRLQRSRYNVHDQGGSADDEGRREPA